MGAILWGCVLKNFYGYGQILVDQFYFDFKLNYNIFYNF